MVQKTVFSLVFVFLAFSTVFAFTDGPGPDSTDLSGKKTFPAKVSDEQSGNTQETGNVVSDKKHDEPEATPMPAKNQNEANISDNEGAPELSNVNNMLRSMANPSEMSLKDRILYNTLQNRMDRIEQKQETQEIDSETILLIILLVVLLAVLGKITGIDILGSILVALLIGALILGILYLAEEV